jgi:hypothetical protein
VGVQAQAIYSGTDTTTQGSWQKSYGADGYSLAGGPQSLPNYDPSFTVSNAASYTWAKSTSDPRALQTGGTGLAACWVKGGTFSFDVALTDGNTHQVAVYALDWDSTFRGETITVVDANSNAVLDTRTITNFHGGVYLYWSVSGHVKINVTWTAGGNAVISGVFFGGGTGPLKVTVNPQSVILIAGQQQTFAAQVTGAGSANKNVTWSNSAPGSISATGVYTAPSVISSAQIVTVTATSAVDGVTSGTATVNLSTSVTGQAIYGGTDTTTQGSWQKSYGADGYSLAGGPQSLPSYDPSFTVSNAASYTWAKSTSDPRALQTGGTGLAACWVAGGTFSFDVALTDGNTHQVAVYALDWDSTARGETITVVDANSNAVLDTRTITNFHGGVYLYWSVSGHVKINVRLTAGGNAVISGVFFGL